MASEVIIRRMLDGGTTEKGRAREPVPAPTVERFVKRDDGGVVMTREKGFAWSQDWTRDQEKEALDPETTQGTVVATFEWTAEEWARIKAL